MATELNEDAMSEAQNSEQENNTPSTPVRQHPLRIFFNDYPEVFQFIGLIVVVCLSAAVVVYFYRYHQTPMEYYAKAFCDCALEPGSNVAYEESIDDFDYLASMNTCFASDFAVYSEGMTILEKKAYLLEFRDEVVKACPHKLDYVFKYE